MTEDNQDQDNQEGAAPLPTDNSDAIHPLGALQQLGLHAKTRTALEAMASQGISYTLAAQRVGMRPDNLLRVFNRPHVRRAYNQVVTAIRQGAAQAAYIRINDLSQTSESERLRFDASRWVAGVDGISPVTKVAGQVNHTHSFAGFEYPDLIDGKASPAQPEGDADEDD